MQIRGPFDLIQNPELNLAMQRRMVRSLSYSHPLTVRKFSLVPSPTQNESFKNLIAQEKFERSEKVEEC